MAQLPPRADGLPRRGIPDKVMKQLELEFADLTGTPQTMAVQEQNGASNTPAQDGPRTAFLVQQE